ncbi:DUF4248 domain-containing protein [Bacteroides sp.]
MEKEEKFPIRTYSKAELAHLYNPDMPIVSALRKLRRWIKKNDKLLAELNATGASRYEHSYTPRQVTLIPHFLGEPG